MAQELKDILGVQNVASLLDEKQVEKIGHEAIDGYKADDTSRAEWKARNEKGMELAMQLTKPKNDPIENAANIAYPLISIASIQFSSRAYPNLIPGWDIVKGKVIGKDESGEKATKADRIQTHMNYQLNEEMEEWQEETDRLLTALPIVGCCFKETYFSPILQRNVSRYIPAIDLVMHYNAQSMATVPRITKKYVLYPNEIVERMRRGTFLDFDYGRAQKSIEGENEKPDLYSTADETKPHVFLEQHCWLDLDEDGYAEPYILNIHLDTQRVVRIKPRFDEGDIEFNQSRQVQRIEARQHYTKFTFLHAPDGGIYDWGFGSLLQPINETVNSTINELLDSGTINNNISGFISKNIALGRSKTGGLVEIPLRGFLEVNYAGDDLRKNIVLTNEFTKEPSAVLFNLLGFMVNAGEKLSSVTELMMGEQTIHNEPATTSLARIEQGQKVFSAIHKRLHRSLKEEFKLLFKLNAQYLNPQTYFTILDDPAQKEVDSSDYDPKSCDIIPTANPDDVSNTQQLMKAQILYSLIGQGFNDTEIKRRFIEALRVPDPEAIMNAPPPPPDPKLVLESEKLDLERSKLEFDMMKFGMEMAEARSRIILNLAKAEAAEAGPQLDQYIAEMNALVSMITKSQQMKGGGEATSQMPTTGVAAPAGMPAGTNGGAMMEPQGMDAGIEQGEIYTR